MKKIFLFYLSDSTIPRYHGHAKTCFEMFQTYHNVIECKPDKIMSACCFRCLKIIVCYILFDLDYVQYLREACLRNA